MKAIVRWRALVLALALLVVWPAGAQAQDDLVIEPAQLEFGEVLAGTEASGVLEVWNDGSEPVRLSSIGLEGNAGPFVLGKDGCESELVLEPGWGCELEVTFLAPWAYRDHEAFVVVQADGDGGAKVATARLTGASNVPWWYLPRHLVAEPGALDFGIVPRGMISSSQGVRVRNAGAGPAVFAAERAVTTSGRAWSHFDVTANRCTGTLSPGDTCEVAVAFSPSVRPGPIGGRPGPEYGIPANAVFAAQLELRLQNGAVGLSLPLKGSIPMLPRPPSPPSIDYGPIEQDLVRLAERVPRLLRGGSRRALRLPSFKAPTAGRLSLRVRGVGRQRRVRLAAGTLRLEAGKAGRLRFSLAPRARKLLRRPVRTPATVVVAFKARATGETFRQSLRLIIRPPAKAGKPRKAR